METIGRLEVKRCRIIWILVVSNYKQAPTLMLSIKVGYIMGDIY